MIVRLVLFILALLPNEQPTIHHATAHVVCVWVGTSKGLFKAKKKAEGLWLLSVFTCMYHYSLTCCTIMRSEAKRKERKGLQQSLQ